MIRNLKIINQFCTEVSVWRGPSYRCCHSFGCDAHAPRATTNRETTINRTCKLFSRK